MTTQGGLSCPDFYLKEQICMDLVKDGVEEIKGNLLQKDNQELSIIFENVHLY